MSTPDNSVGPEYPGLSDNPMKSRSGAPASFTEWLRQPYAWIAGLSPAQADTYDSGEVTSGLTLTPLNASDITYSLRRRGKEVDARVDFTYQGATMTGGASGNVADVELFYFPAYWRTWRVTYDAYLGSTSLYRVGPRLDASGLVSVVDAAPGVTISQGDPLRLNAKFWLP